MTDVDAETTHQIIEPLAGLAVPLDDLNALTDNPRRGDVEAVARSLDRFGQRKPVVVNVNGNTVEAGNHTVEGARLLGWTHVAAVFVDDDEATAGGYSLADNRTADLAGYDDEALADLVRDVMEADLSLLEAASFSEDDVADLLAELGDDLDLGMMGDPAPTPADREQNWEQSAVRSVLLAYGFARYAWVIRQLADLRREMGLDNNADVVLALIAERVGEDPPVDTAGEAAGGDPDA